MSVHIHDEFKEVIRVVILLLAIISLVFLHYHFIFSSPIYHWHPRLDDAMHVATGICLFSFILFFYKLIIRLGYIKKRSIAKLTLISFVLCLPTWEGLESLMSFIAFNNGSVKPLEMLKDSSFASMGG